MAETRPIEWGPVVRFGEGTEITVDGRPYRAFLRAMGPLEDDRIVYDSEHPSGHLVCGFTAEFWLQPMEGTNGNATRKG